MLYRVLAGPGDPCSIVWSSDHQGWLHFDESCGDIMQYTGLHDRLGKEIYEGDIVDWKIGEPPEGIYEVKWYEHGWYLERKDGWKEALYQNLADGRGSSLEIIGNIYEHGHLLTT